MKVFVALFISTFVIVSGEPGIGQNSHGRVGPPPLINRPKLPDNSRFRFRRSPEPEPQGSIVFQGTKPMSGPERRPNWSLNYQHDIYKGKHGSISAGAGAMKIPGQRVQPNAQIQGELRFRRSPEPEPQGSIVFQGTKPMSGPERRPNWSLNYQHDIYKGKHGSISAAAGAMKIPGQRVQPNVLLQGQLRFRRSPEELQNSEINVVEPEAYEEANEQ